MLTKLCAIKTTYEALHNGVAGGNARIITCDNQSIIAFKRVKNGKQITVVVNMSDTEQKVKYDEKLLSGKILFNGDGTGMSDKIGSDFKSTSSNTLSAWEYYIIVSE
jgi:hypothetical protein